MKKSRLLIFLIVLFLIVLGFPTDSFAYVFVHGYYRSDGTYVRPHVRSSPNAFKFDNYSWRPGQGLFNSSYYSPTKNYSSDWYIPSYITDPDYYIGKRLYESNRSYLKSYNYLNNWYTSYYLDDTYDDDTLDDIYDIYYSRRSNYFNLYNYSKKWSVPSYNLYYDLDDYDLDEYLYKDWLDDYFYEDW